MPDLILKNLRIKFLLIQLNNFHSNFHLQLQYQNLVVPAWNNLTVNFYAHTVKVSISLVKPLVN